MMPKDMVWHYKHNSRVKSFKNKGYIIKFPYEKDMWIKEIKHVVTDMGWKYY